jgi:hypothetical protein
MAYNAKPIILFDNRFDDGMPSATDTASGYYAANIRDLRTYTWHQFAAAGTKYYTIDCGEAKAADCLGIRGHNLGTAAASVSVESSANNLDWTERLAAFNPANDRAILKTFTSASARYWRVKIVTADTAAQCAVLMLGTRLTMEKWPSGNFDPAQEKPVSSSRLSQQGHLLGVLIDYVEIEIAARFQRLSPTWIETYFRPAWDNHIHYGRPFFWAWDITNHPSEICYARIADNYSLSMPYDPVRRSLTLDMRAIKEQ